MRRVMANLLQEKNFGPNVIYYFFLMSGGPRADELDLVNCPQEATPETMRG